MNVSELLVVPIGVVTVTVLAVRGAKFDTVKVAVSDVPVPFTTMLLVLTPNPDTFTVVAPVKAVPVRVTVRFTVPEAGRAADTGRIPVSVGDTTTVNPPVTVTGPPGVVTVTSLAPSTAEFETVKLAVSDVPAAFTVTLLTVTPLTKNPARLTATEVVPATGVKLVPSRVTLMMLP